MKYTIILFMSALLVQCSSSNSDIKSQIIHNLNEQKTSWNDGDIPGFMKHYWKNDSMAFMGKNGIKYGWQNTLEGYQENYSTKELMGKLEFGVEKLDVLSPNSASLLGTWHLERDTLSVGGYFSLIWRKIDGEWVIVKDHTS